MKAFNMLVEGAAASTAAPTQATEPSPTVIEQIGDIQIVRSSRGDYGVQFETDDECVVSVWTFTDHGAVALAKLLNREAMSSFVAVYMDVPA